MPRTREIVGSVICVGSFFGFVYAGVQRGLVCTNLPSLDVVSGQTISYPCKGLTAYITASQEFTIHWLPFIVLATGWLGYYIATRRK